MKKLLLIVFSTVLHCYAYCQHCTSYFFENKKIIELDIYNKRGDKDGFIVHKPTNVVVKGNTSSALIHTQIFDKNKKLLSSSSNTVKCAGKMIMIDMKLFIPQQQAEQYGLTDAKSKNAFLEYPSDMKTGDQLKDGSFDMEVDKNGLKQTLQMNIINRVVSGVESVTTSAGKWDCFIIKYHIKLNLQTGPIAIPLTMEITEWYTPSFGIIKKMTNNGSTELVSIR